MQALQSSQTEQSLDITARHLACAAWLSSAEPLLIKPVAAKSVFQPAAGVETFTAKRFLCILFQIEALSYRYIFRLKTAEEKLIAAVTDQQINRS